MNDEGERSHLILNGTQSTSYRPPPASIAYCHS